MKNFCIILIALFSTFEAKSFVNQANFYGYSQIDYSIQNKYQKKATFEITRVNIIGDFDLTSGVRFLSDIELEHNLNVTDHGVIGNIKFSRVWAEYSVHKEFKIRAGKILTNFGLYNKIHDASPTYFSINSPNIYSKFGLSDDKTVRQRFFGKYMMGIEATGTIDVDNNGSQLEYSLMYGNGRNEFIAEDTYIEGKNAISARVYYIPAFIRGLQIGASYYTDRNPIGIAGAIDEVESTLACELQYEYGDFQLQSEIFLPSFKNSTGKDQHSTLTYLHLAYTLFDKLTPYTQYSYIKFDNNADQIQSQFLIGLNYALTTNFYIKSEVIYYKNEVSKIHDEFGAFKASLSIAF